MRCRVCEGWVGLRATSCECGFDTATGDVTVAIERARRDLWTGRKLQLAGFAGLGLLTLYVVAPTLWTTLELVRLSLGLPGVLHYVPVFLAIYGLGHGTLVRHRARRRLCVTSEMSQLPAARVVVRDERHAE